MRSVAFVLACLACAPHSRRVKTTSEQLQGKSYAEFQSSIVPVSLQPGTWHGHTLGLRHGHQLGLSHPRIPHVHGHNGVRTRQLSAISMKYDENIGDLIDDSGDRDEGDFPTAPRADIQKLKRLLKRRDDTSKKVSSDLLSRPGFAPGDKSPAIQNTGEDELYKQSDEQLQFDTVVTELEVDFLEMFQRDPNWDIFADGFILIEPTGDVVQGLGPIKIMFLYLRTMRNLVPLKADVDVQFTGGDGIFSGPRQKTVLDVRWKVKLGLELPNAPGDSVVDVVGKIHLNDDNKVDYVQIDKWVVTGELLKAWPSFRQTADRTIALNEIRDRATMVLKEANAVTQAGATPKANQALVNAASDLAAMFISSELQYLATLSVQAGLLGGASDAISQAIDGVPVNGSHVGAMALSVGALSGVFEALWLQVLEREVPGTNVAAVLTKVVADFVIAGTLYNSAILLFVPILTAVLSGVPLGPDHMLDGWTLDQFTNTTRLELFTWVPYGLLSFSLIKPKNRPFAAIVVGFVNEIVLSGITRHSGWW